MTPEPQGAVSCREKRALALPRSDREATAHFIEQAMFEVIRPREADAELGAQPQPRRIHWLSFQDQPRSGGHPVSACEVAITQYLAESEPQLPLLIRLGDALDLDDVQCATPVPRKVERCACTSVRNRREPVSEQYARDRVLRLDMSSGAPILEIRVVIELLPLANHGKRGLPPVRDCLSKDQRPASPDKRSRCEAASTD